MIMIAAGGLPELERRAVECGVAGECWCHRTDPIFASVDNFSQLPKEILLMVISQVDCSDSIRGLACTNRYFHWLILEFKDFPIPQMHLVPLYKHTVSGLLPHQTCSLRKLLSREAGEWTGSDPRRPWMHMHPAYLSIAGVHVPRRAGPVVQTLPSFVGKVCCFF